MAESMKNVYLAIVLAPLVGAVIAGLFRNTVGRGRGAHGHDCRGRDLHRSFSTRLLGHGGGSRPGP